MPLGRGMPPPRPVVVPRFLGAGVENLDDGFELAGGFSTKDVSVVLRACQHQHVAVGDGNSQERRVPVAAGRAARVALERLGEAVGAGERFGDRGLRYLRQYSRHNRHAGG